MSIHEHIAKPLLIATTLSALIAVLLATVSVFEDIDTHSIALSALVVTALVVIYHPRSDSSQPHTIIASYCLVGVVSYCLSLTALPIFMTVALSIGISCAILLYADTLHPPAIVYGLGFTFAGYGLTELLMTVPLLLGFFIILTLVAFIVRQTMYLFHIIDIPKQKKRTPLQTVESLVHTTVPFALVLLLVLIIVDYFFPNVVELYGPLLQNLDIAIISLLGCDLFFKYRKSRNTKQFLQHNWLDILAIIPFFLTLRLARGVTATLRLGRLIETGTEASRMYKILKPVSASPRLTKMIERFETSTR